MNSSRNDHYVDQHSLAAGESKLSLGYQPLRGLNESQGSLAYT